MVVRVKLSKHTFQLCKEIVIKEMGLRFTSLTNIFHETSSYVLRLDHGVGGGVVEICHSNIFEL